MKKILALFVLVFFFSLTGCLNKEVIEDPDTKIIENLKLDKVTKVLNQVTDTKNYVEILVNDNIKESLFVANFNYDELFKKNADKIKELKIRALFFVTDITSTQEDLIITELYKNITKDHLGLDNNLLTMDKNKKDETVISHTTVSTSGYELYEQGKTNINLSVVYLPIKAKVVVDSEEIVNNFVMVPVSYGFNVHTYDENTNTHTYSNEEFLSYNSLNYVFKKTNYLPNKGPGKQ